jgi:hypothetical protein
MNEMDGGVVQCGMVAQGPKRRTEMGRKEQRIDEDLRSTCRKGERGRENTGATGIKLCLECFVLERTEKPTSWPRCSVGRPIYFARLTVRGSVRPFGHQVRSISDLYSILANMFLSCDERNNKQSHIIDEW